MVCIMHEKYRGENRIFKSQQLGLAVGNILLWGVEQQARVTDLNLRNIHKNDYWPKGDDLIDWLKQERERHNIKLFERQLAADSLTSLGMELNIRDRQRAIVATGKLIKVNLASASILMANISLGTTDLITFAERLPRPVPPDLDQPPIRQSYYGHRLIVNFDVISIPALN